MSGICIVVYAMADAVLVVAIKGAGESVPSFSGTFGFLSIMIPGLLLMASSLSGLSLYISGPSLIIFFVTTFIPLLSM